MVSGVDRLSLYQWNTHHVQHYFCSVYGIYTHHRRRGNPREFGFNVACVDSVDLAALGPIGLGDGASQTLVDG